MGTLDEMNKALSDAVGSLAEACRLVSAGVIAFPPKMAESIARRVEKEAASYFLALLRDKIGKKPPKINHNELSYIRETARDMSEGGQEDLADIEKWLRSSGLISYFPLSVFVNEVAPTLANIKNLEDLDGPYLVAVTQILIRGANHYASTAYAKAARAVFDHAMSIKSNATSTSDKRKFDFYSNFGVRPSLSIRREWKEPIDWTGMPAHYPKDALDDGLREVSVRLYISQKNRSFAGRWKSKEDLIELVFPSEGEAWSEQEFASLQAQVRATLDHELRHMVQTIMHRSLRVREANKRRASGETNFLVPYERGRKAGTPLGPKDRVPKADGISLDKTEYPKANKDERYYLNPIEFYPHIGSAVDLFIRWFRLDKWMQPPDGGATSVTLERWKAWVGLPHDKDMAWHNGKVEVRPFFAALKKHEPKLWRKAVSEGWHMLKEKTKMPDKAPMKASTDKLTFEDEKAPEGLWKAGREYVLKNLSTPAVQTVLNYVLKNIFEDNDRIRTTEIAKATGVPLATTRKIMLGLHRLSRDGSVLSYIDLKIARHVMKKVGPNDYRWELDQG